MNNSSINYIESEPSAQVRHGRRNSQAMKRLGSERQTEEMLAALVPPAIRPLYDAALSDVEVSAERAAKEPDILLSALHWFVSNVVGKSGDDEAAGRAALINKARPRAFLILRHLHALELTESRAANITARERNEQAIARSHTCPLCHVYDVSNVGLVRERVLRPTGAYGSGSRFRSCFRCFEVALQLVVARDASQLVHAGRTRADLLREHLGSH